MISVSGFRAYSLKINNDFSLKKVMDFKST